MVTASKQRETSGDSSRWPFGWTGWLLTETPSSLPSPLRPHVFDSVSRETGAAGGPSPQRKTSLLSLNLLRVLCLQASPAFVSALLLFFLSVCRVRTDEFERNVIFFPVILRSSEQPSSESSQLTSAQSCYIT